MSDVDGSGASGWRRPTIIQYASLAWVLGGLFGVLGGVYFYLTRQRLIDAAIRANDNPELTADEITRTGIAFSWWLLGGSLLFAAAFAYLLHRARDRARWARITLVIV